MIDLVVSAYKADLDWTTKCVVDRVFVYDKGSVTSMRDRISLQTRVRMSILRLPNVGKNDHTYAHHIVEHYDDLADWTVFTPDYPFDHMGGTDFALMLFSSPFVKVPWFCRLKDWGPDGRLEWHRWTNRPDANGTTWAERYASGVITPASVSFIEYATMRGIDLTKWRGYSAGGVIGVPKSAILQRSKEYYAEIRDNLSRATEPELGHYMERLWYEIFSQEV